MSTRTVEVKFYFFQVHYADNCVIRLPEMIEKIRDMPLEKRIIKMHTVPRFLSDDTEEDLRSKAVLFTSKRMKAIPSKIKGDGSRESLRLAEDEGLAEDVAMAYDLTGSVVAIQQNRYAMSEGLISAYISKNFPDNPVYFKPVVAFDALKRFSSSDQLRKLHIKLAGAVNFKELQEMGLSVNDSVMLQSMMMSPTLEITWSAWREHEGLLDRFVKIGNALKMYFDRGNSSQVLSLDAVVRNRSGDKFETEPIDLLTDRIFSYADIPMNEQKELDKNALLEAALSALKEKSHELENFIQQKGV